MWKGHTLGLLSHAVVHCSPSILLGQGAILVVARNVPQRPRETGQDDIEVIQYDADSLLMNLRQICQFAQVACANADRVDNAGHVNVIVLAQGKSQAFYLEGYCVGPLCL